MNDVRRIVRAITISGALLAILALPALGEVGAYVQSSGRVSSYVFQIIIDEADPVDTAWMPYHVAGATPIILNEFGADNEDGEPSLIHLPSSGLPLVAWSRNTPSGYDIVVSHFEEGAWTTPQVVANANANELDPDLVVNPSDGSVHLLYWTDDGSPRVMHQEAPADLSSWSAPVQVSHAGDIACRPAGVFLDGTLRVVYELHDLGIGLAPKQIVFGVYDGQEFISELVAATQYAEANWPKVHSADGRLWIDWIDDESDMAWTRQSTSGSWEPVQTQHFETVEQREFHIRGLIRKLALN